MKEIGDYQVFDELKSNTLADMIISRHKRGNGCDHYGAQCKSCPYGYATAINATNHPESIQMMEKINSAGAFHKCHSRGKDESLACRGFAEHFKRLTELTRIEHT